MNAPIVPKLPAAGARFARPSSAFIAAALLAACACGPGNRAAFQTLDGAAPLVIGHRGFPGLYPEETQRTVPGVAVDVTYALATYGGPAQYLSDRTDPNDPASVLKSLVVDGEDHTGDWSITDFTVAELKQWIGGTTDDARDQRPSRRALPISRISRRSDDDDCG